jgi:hypothetical protein
MGPFDRAGNPTARGPTASWRDLFSGLRPEGTTFGTFAERRRRVTTDFAESSARPQNTLRKFRDSRIALANARQSDNEGMCCSLFEKSGLFVPDA